MIYGRHQNLKAEARGRTLAKVQKLWSEKDFESLKLNLLCLELGVETRMERKKVDRIFERGRRHGKRRKLDPQATKCKRHGY